MLRTVAVSHSNQDPQSFVTAIQYIQLMYSTTSYIDTDSVPQTVVQGQAGSHQCRHTETEKRQNKQNGKTTKSERSNEKLWFSTV